MITKHKKIITLAVLASLALQPTQHALAGEQEIFGTILGAAGGAAIGSNIGKGKGNTVSIAIGTLLGAGIGNNIGKSLGRQEYTTVSQYSDSQPSVTVYQNKLHARHTKPWRHRHPHHQTKYYKKHYVTPTYYHYVNYATTVQEDEPYCREFTQTIDIGGTQQNSYGNACLQPDGTWKIVSQSEN